MKLSMAIFSAKRIGINLGRKVKQTLQRFFGVRSKPKKRRISKAPAALIETASSLPLKPAREIPVVAAVEEFSLVQLSAHTQKAYGRDLRDFFSYLMASESVGRDWPDRVDPLMVARFRSSLIERKMAQSSVNRKLAVVKSFFSWAQARGWVDLNPADVVKGFPQTQDSKTGFLTDESVGVLLTSIDCDPRGASLGMAQKKVVVESLLMLGLRRGEAVKLKVKDLEYNDNMWLVRVQGKGSRDRRLPVPPRLLWTWSRWFQRLADNDCPEKLMDEAPNEWIKWMRRWNEQPILVSMRSRGDLRGLSTAEVARIVRREAHRAGLVQRVSPHVLRATAITSALDQGATHRGVQQMAGWTSPLMITRYDKRLNDPRFSAVFKLSYAQWSPVPGNVTVKTTAGDQHEPINRQESPELR